MAKMLQDKVAIITGSGRGIGQAAALMFAREGAKVVVSDIDPEPANQTVEEIKKNGGEAYAYVGDVTDSGFAEAIVKTAVNAFDAVHILVNNAGYNWDSSIHTMSDKMFDAMINLHIKAPFKIIRAASPYFRDAAKKEMAEGKSVARKIINISSISGTSGAPGQANYSSAKSAILGLTKTMAKEWGRYNVQCNCVVCGLIDTRQTRDKEQADDLYCGNEKVEIGLIEAHRQVIIKTIPMRRPGTPEEVAAVIMFLASPLSNYVSGQLIGVSGGLML